MRKLIYYLPLLLTFLFFAKGCNYENPIVSADSQNINQTNENMGPILDSTNSYETAIITSGNVKIGALKIWRDNSNLFFKFTIRNVNYLKNIHLAVSPYNNNIPLTNHCPNIENFNYKVHNLPVNTRTYTFTKPLITFPIVGNIAIYISAQIEYENNAFHPDCNVAWARGMQFANCSTFSKYFAIKFLYMPSH